jgi:hypothetical protein
MLRAAFSAIDGGNVRTTVKALSLEMSCLPFFVFQEPMCSIET